MSTPLTMSEQLRSTLSERDARLMERSLQTLEENKDHACKPFFKGRLMICPGLGSFKGIWNWDTAFHAIGLARFDAALAIEQIEGFLDHMLPDGMLPDLVWRKDGSDRIHSSKPPVFPWAAYEVYRHTGDTAFLKRIYPQLVLNESFWRTQRYDGTLFYYSHYRQGTAEEELRWAKFETGWDNSVRWDDDMTAYYPVDLNCYMLTLYESMSKIAALIGEPSDEWERRAATMRRLIEDTFWNESLGAYTDRNRLTGAFSSCLTPASFMPLFVRTASAERAARMAQLAADPAIFNATMPTVSYDNPAFSQDYWRGPLWMNVAYFAAKGLKQYGLPIADTIKENVLNLVDGEKTGIYENYDTIARKGQYRKNFSWSACFIIEFILNW